MANENTTLTDQAVEQGGAYEVIRKRLLQQATDLDAKVAALNEARLLEFGQSDTKIVARVRVRTENNCTARDIVQVGDLLLFGYNVYIGLKVETQIADVFSLFRVVEAEAGKEIEAVALANSFLTQTGFVNDFRELYTYYKDSRLLELVVKDGKLLASFQIGERLDDVRVFRWSISPDGKTVTYIDNRGAADIQLPPSFDFEWKALTREHQVLGRYPHYNIDDRLFVETVNGDLTIKVENNTDIGRGIYRESVEDANQSIDDAIIFYALLGDIILLKVRPYREEAWRYLVFNELTNEVLRLDAIGNSCVQLPEGHGIIFPGGCYLRTGDLKVFNEDTHDLLFKRMVRSPNGEDVLYAFYAPGTGRFGLFCYNLITKELANPIFSNGYALADDGELIIFTAQAEPTRIHPMQIWQTQFFSDEFASRIPPKQNFYGKIGNAELVRGISDVYGVTKIIHSQKASMALYEDLHKSTLRLFDAYHWLSATETNGVGELLRQIAQSADLVVDEYEKVASIQQRAIEILQQAEQTQHNLFASLTVEQWEEASLFVEALAKLNKQRGHLHTLRDVRYIELPVLQQLEEALEKAQQHVAQQTVVFLSGPNALQPYLHKVDKLVGDIDSVKGTIELTPIISTIEETASGLDVLSELMATLNIEDATQRTKIVEVIANIYAKLNQTKAHAKHKQSALRDNESVAQFGAQFNLFSQSITHALSVATTPEKCDEQLTKLIVQLENFESQFSENEQFLADIIAKREEIHDAFEIYKQQLLDARQRKCQAVQDAANRILKNIERHSQKFVEVDDLNTYFAADALVVKIFALVEQLRALGDSVKADDIESKFKALKDQAIRSLRDKSDIFEEGGNIIKLGPRHRFSVNTQELDLTILPREDSLYFHLTGTDYFEEVNNVELAALRSFGAMNMESETAVVSRAEYLAFLVWQAADQGKENLSMTTLHNALADEKVLLNVVQQFALPRYKDGYEKGIHDHDAVRILQKLIPLAQQAGVLRYDPFARGLACVFWWATQQGAQQQTWASRAVTAAQLLRLFKSNQALESLVEEVSAAITHYLHAQPIAATALQIRCAARYLIDELSQSRLEFVVSRYAQQIVELFKIALTDDVARDYQHALAQLKSNVSDQWALTQAWSEALLAEQQLPHLRRYVPEAIALLIVESALSRRYTELDTDIVIDGLLSEHSLIQNRQLKFTLDDYLLRLTSHCEEVLPAYQQYLSLRQHIISQERKSLKLGSFKAKPLSSFVRNKLISESYLPLIGDNLAKQMGTVGQNKRTDLMGLLMMISPPGYGKTTLMEYVADRLGLIFMKINGPALGHQVLSLDPASAPNATAKQELEKLNLALKMGNNVMLYVDDIQHTNPEFLQKFISLCDGTRRIEGVWKNETFTYDLRSKKFCVVMAGNPYTESGEVFKIPDMLANRADIYNLGDILGGMENVFKLSYIENSLTSNSVLAPLAIRDQNDIYQLIELAQEKVIDTQQLSHSYSAAELDEIVGILKKMFRLQEVVLKVNQQYIASAAQADKYRVEPPFKLQGSYRNMNKMAEKISPVMNDQEFTQMIQDHYVGEAQLLTNGTEENLLKLAELLGNLTDVQANRWDAIKQDFLRLKAMGGDDTDSAIKIANQVAEVASAVVKMGKTINQESTLVPPLMQLMAQLEQWQKAPVKVALQHQPLPELMQIADTLDKTMDRLTGSLDKRMEFDVTIIKRISKLSEDLRTFSMGQSAKKKPQAMKDFGSLTDDDKKDKSTD